ncbi:MAG TPA: DNA alkylation repair protein [Candidatus Thermoplasmatota archaeon]|nr:DNA alkylation repair protein [Candidatus Thermoplasmatota archaeon]
MSAPPKRKGARSRAEIPPEVLRGINEGTMETITLVEMLAADLHTLLTHTLPQTSLPQDAAQRVLAVARDAASLGVTARMRTIGAALQAEGGASLRRTLQAHPSDLVRELACMMVEADAALTPGERMDALLPFAADAHMGVREMAWFALRPALAKDVPGWVKRLEPWARHPDPNVRRCAVEVTRPRGVWCAHLPEMIAAPELGLPLLEPNRSHPSRYLQTSVANWLNDASKSKPEWVRGVCERWLEESPTRETAWIVNHATRTLRKAGKAREH